MLLKNTLSLALAEIIRPLVIVVYLGYVSRMLGINDFGKLGAILAFLFLFEAASAMGLRGIIVRDVAVDTTRSSQYLTCSVALSLVASVISLLLVYLLLPFFQYSEQMNSLIKLMGATLFFFSMTSHLQALLEGCQRMGVKATLTIAEALLRAGSGILVVFMGYGLEGVVWALVGVRMFFCIFTFLVVVRIIGPPSLHCDRNLYGLILKEVWPFLATSLLAAIYWRTDILMLSKLTNMQAVGTYTAAYKIVELCINLTLSYIGALYPVIALLAQKSPDQFKVSSLNSVRYLFALTLPVAIVTTAFASNIIQLVFGTGYQDSVICLQVLIWVICLYPLVLMFAKMLAATHYQKKDFAANVIAVLLNVTCNAFLIPKFGFLGAAYATLISIFCFMLVQYFFVRRMVFKGPFLSQLYKPVIAGVAMAMLLYFPQESLNIPIATLSLILYAVLIYSLKGITKQEVNSMVQFLKIKAKDL